MKEKLKEKPVGDRPKAKSGFGLYWDIIEVPVYILAGISLVGLLLQLVGGSAVAKYVGYLDWLLTIGVFASIGYYVAARRKMGAGFAAKSAALAGLISGLFAAVLSVVSYYLFPSLFSEAIQNAVAQGAPREIVEMGVKIGVYAGLLIGPVVNAGIGAGIGALAAWLTRISSSKK